MFGVLVGSIVRVCLPDLGAVCYGTATKHKVCHKQGGYQTRGRAQTGWLLDEGARTNKESLRCVAASWLLLLGRTLGARGSRVLTHPTRRHLDLNSVSGVCRSCEDETPAM